MKPVRTFAPIFSSSRQRCDEARPNQAPNLNRDTSDATHSQITSKMQKCFAKNRTTSHFPRELGCGLFQDIALSVQLGDLLAKPVYIDPLWLPQAMCLKGTARGSTNSPLILLRCTLSSRSWSGAASATVTR